MIELALYAIIAVFIFSRLYSSFGKISASDLFRDMRMNASDVRDDFKAEDIVDGHGLEIALADAQLISTMPAEVAEKASFVLEQAKAIDPLFSLTEFLEGAVIAFEMIVKKFQEGDVASLSLLLGSELLEKLKAEIILRNPEYSYHAEFVKINHPVITDIKIDSCIVLAEVSFSSQQINFVKDRAGNVVSGSVSKILKMNDIWSFSGDLMLHRNRWRLILTRSVNS